MMMSKREEEYKCKCEVVIKGREKRKENGSPIDRIVTVQDVTLLC